MILWVPFAAPETTATSHDDSRIQEDDLYLMWGKRAPMGTQNPLIHLLVSHTYGGIPRSTSRGLVAKSTVMVNRVKEDLLHISHPA